MLILFFLFNIQNGRPELNTRTTKLKRYNIIHGHLGCLFYPMNDSVESDIENTLKKKVLFLPKRALRFMYFASRN